MALPDDSNHIIQGLWIGPKLSRLEQLSIRSFQAHGHEYHLYTYDREIRGVPEGVVLHDANAILPRERIFKYRNYDTYAGFSNYFRYRLLFERGGWWADTDLICLKPFEFPDPYVFSSEEALEPGAADVINVGAIKAPMGAEALRQACLACEQKKPEDWEWGEMGPRLFSRCIRAAGLEAHVQAARVFCPVPYFRWDALINPDARPSIPDDAHAVHFWNEIWRRRGFDKDDEYDPRCLYEQLQSRWGERMAPRAVAPVTSIGAPVAGGSAGDRNPQRALPRISAAVLTKNSEPRLARCLESIVRSGVADEIVVCVDAATTDHTFAVAQRFTPNVHLVATEGYFESGLERMVSLCSGDLVIRVDDDETLGGNWDKASLQLLVAGNQFTNVWVPVRYLVPPGDCYIASSPWFPDLHLRVFTKDSERITWPRRVHEEIGISGRSVSLFDRWIDHHTFIDRPRGERQRRNVRYRELNPDHDLSYYYLYEGAEYRTLPCAMPAAEAFGRSERNTPAAAYAYDPGSPIDFSLEGNALDYTGAGWGDGESWGTWTTGECAEVSLPLATPFDVGAKLSMEVIPFLTALHPELRVVVNCNCTQLAELCLSSVEWVVREMDIPAAALEGSHQARLQFQIREPRCPAETGESDDRRMLGLGFRSLRVSAKERESREEGAAVGWRPSPGRTRTESERERFARRALNIGKRALPGADIDVFWDEMWIFRVGGHCFPSPETESAEAAPWYELAGAAARYVAEANDYWAYRYRPKPGDVVVDIGAGRGEDTLAFSVAVGSSGRVYAFEAHPATFLSLKKFCQLNGLANVTAFEVACVDRPAKLHIETLPSWKQNYVRDGEPSPGSFAVDGLPFDQIWEAQGVGPIDLLKMNIEGAEQLALPGARRALACTRNIAVATHDYRFERGEGDWFRTRDFVREFLRDCGFQIEQRMDSRVWARDHIHGYRPE